MAVNKDELQAVVVADKFTDALALLEQPWVRIGNRPVPWNF